MTPRTSLALLLLPLPLQAQTIWTVPITQTDIQPVIAGAAPGDVIQLAPNGRYDPFTLNKGLTIRGPAVVAANGISGRARSAISIPLGQHAILREITHSRVTFAYSQLPVGGLDVTAGRVSFFDCEFYGAGVEPFGFGPGGLNIVGADVTLQRCIVDGTTEAMALYATRSNVVAISTSFEGAGARLIFPQRGSPRAVQCRPAVQIEDALFHGTDLTLSARPGDDYSFYALGRADPRPALEVLAGATAWITDSVMTGGDHNAPLPGAAGIDSTGTTWLQRVTVSGGAGTPPGPPTVGTVSFDPSLLGIEDSLPSELPLGATDTFTVRGPASTPISLLLSLTARPAMATPITRQPIWHPAPAPVLADTLGGTGARVISIRIPNDSTLTDRTFWLHGFGGTTLPVEVLPPFAVTVR